MGNNKLDKVSSTLAVEYKDFFQEILTKIQSARYEMLLSVSKQTLLLYWDIGKAVSKKMASGGWGQSVVEQLSKDLQTECPGVRGFSTWNIWRMKTFYEFYAGFLISAPTGAEIPETTETKISAPVGAKLPTNTKSICYNSAVASAELQIAEIVNSATMVAEFEKPPPLVAEVGWKQNCIILEKCKNLKQIEFYLRMTKAKGWSKLDLLEKINNNYFENHSLAQNNFDSVVPEALKAQVAWELSKSFFQVPLFSLAEAILCITVGEAKRNLRYWWATQPVVQQGRHHHNLALAGLRRGGAFFRRFRFASPTVMHILSRRDKTLVAK